MTEPVEFSLDGESVLAHDGETIFDIACRQGIEIPHLCHRPAPGYKADGNCRACMVEIEGERVLAASCIRRPSPGMVVRTTSPRAAAARHTVFELLASDMPARECSADARSSFWQQAEKLKINPARLALTAPPPANGASANDSTAHSIAAAGKMAHDVDGESAAPGAVAAAPRGARHDTSHPAIAVNLDDCIACGLCARACHAVQHNDVIAMGFRGSDTRPVFDIFDPLGASSCVGCGECVQACPTGALLEKSVMEPGFRRRTAYADTQIDSLCPYCGVGCQTRIFVAGGKIIKIDGRSGPANENRLCVKGRFGFDYIRHAGRLKTPLIRREDAEKAPFDHIGPGDIDRVFRPASWEEALDHAALGFMRILNDAGGSALAGFGSAKCSNEEAYLFQKLIRQGFGTNNVDHCTRLCHASSVAALLEGVGSGAVSAPFTAALEADCILVIGARPADNHPVAASYLKEAAARGATLIVLDPRGQSLMRHADHAIRFRPGTDVALLNALLHVIVEEELFDKEYLAAHVDGFEALKENVAKFSPEDMAAICAVDAAELRKIARIYAKAERAIVFWGMGISQHVHGTDNARCLIALALVCGHVGRPGTGLHPLRGQNNVQGASDAGLIPMFYPDYAPVDDSRVAEDFEGRWGRPLDRARGLTVVEIMHAIHRSDIRGMYIMGENPAMSDPDLNHARAALAQLEHLVVQDIFLTETAAFADIILPASAHGEKTGSYTNTNRQIQIGRPALTPPGEARQDWEILVAFAQRLGLDWTYRTVPEIYREMHEIMPSLAGIPWERLEREECVTYPVDSADMRGRDILFDNGFPTAHGRARLVPVELAPPDEVPDETYPLILTTGRLLEHWHTGAMTRRSGVLDALEPHAMAAMNGREMTRLELQPGALVSVTTRRGAVTARLREDREIADGMVFMPFCFAEAPANRLTNPQLDPVGKIPEYKYCAARVDRLPVRAKLRTPA